MYSFGVGITYAELAATANAIAAWLQAQDLNRGDRVAIMLPNIAAYFPIVFGILKAGFTVVNVNPLYTPSELSHQLKDSGARIIFVMSRFEPTVKQAHVGTPLEKVVRVKPGDLLGLKGHLVNLASWSKSPVARERQVEDALDFAGIVKAGRIR
ncbi:MAG: AMP-binding protein, partial [Gammaproteobacteria bacterium]